MARLESEIRRLETLDAIQAMQPRVNLIDVGASGGIQNRWHQIRNFLTVIGFEPDPREFGNLQQLNDASRWHNTALWEKSGMQTLYVTRWQTNTSLFKPNRSIIDQIWLTPEDFDIVSRIQVSCETLDAIISSNGYDIDVIKLDTQGSELGILKGGCEAVQNDIFAIEVEVEFVELYKDQPLYYKIDQFLRPKGFQLIDFGNLLFHKWGRLFNLGGVKGQLISADALFFKGIDHAVGLVERGGLSKLWRIVLICLVYGYPDYGMLICQDERIHRIIPQEQLSSLQTILKRRGKLSANIPNFRGRGALYRIFKQILDYLRPTGNAYWGNDLGN